jgi:hypothetical protein
MQGIKIIVLKINGQGCPDDIQAGPVYGIKLDTVAKVVGPLHLKIDRTCELHSDGHQEADCHQGQNKGHSILLI